MLPPVAPYDGLALPFPLRPHQTEALDAVERAIEGGSTRLWVTMPPGAGKTYVGTEVARRLGRRVLVLSPNTAITAQWARTWESYGGAPAGNRRDLRRSFTSLTYQTLAVFDDERAEGRARTEEATDDGSEVAPRARTPHLDRLHEHGRELVETMREAGPLLLVLDECHHLMEVWGELLREVLDQLPEAMVLGLTATPPASMTQAQADLAGELFGPVIYEARIPALVTAGTLAPYAELAWLVEPTAEESAWLAEQSERFTALVADLFAPDFGSTPLPQWLTERFAGEPATGDERATAWEERAAREPELTDAVLRLAHAGLVALPAGAVLRERHRTDPVAEDWRLVVDDWLRGCIQPRSEQEGPQATGDRAVLESVRRTLPSIGYVWTRHGIRSGRGTVDRVTARSRSKETAVAGIAAAEGASLGDRARVLVLCDHERATATTRRRLGDGPGEGASLATPEPAGSALGVLASLVTDRDSSLLHPMLVTGRTVAGARSTLEAFVEWLRPTHPMVADSLQLGPQDGVWTLTGRWTPSAWVDHVTRYFAQGRTRCLVGTRGLLGEGWDAPCVTSLVDLTTVTTPTAVVQTRGRALRTDPADPAKVALVWTVVCVAEGHVAGANDWDRFTRKHHGYFTVDERGEVVDGVAGVDSTFSEYAPPPREDHDAIDARMLVRAEDRDAVREQWRSRGTGQDVVGHVLRVRRAGATPTPPAVDAGTSGLTSWRTQSTVRPGAGLVGVPLVASVVLAAAVLLVGLPLPVGIVLAVLLLALGGVAALAQWGRATLTGASRHQVGLAHVAAAVADGLHAAGRTPVGSDALRIGVTPDGQESFELTGAGEQGSATYAAALEEVVSPMAAPRYVVPRMRTSAPAGWEGWKRGLRSRGRHRPDGEVWHTVPAVVADHRRNADAYAAAWHPWVGGSQEPVQAVYVHSPEGAGVLATHRGEDPFSATCVVRRTWS